MGGKLLRQARQSPAHLVILNIFGPDALSTGATELVPIAVAATNFVASIFAIWVTIASECCPDTFSNCALEQASLPTGGVGVVRVVGVGVVHVGRVDLVREIG